MIQPLFLGSIGMPELIIIFIIVLLLFGAKKIPELMNGLGKGVKSFKKGMKEVEDEIEKIDTDVSSDSEKYNKNEKN